MSTAAKATPPRKIWLGRGHEIAELEVGLAELLTGRGSLFLLTGEPGIGKTRLADELARLASGRGASVHWGRAWEAGGAPSYWPFIQALRSMSRAGDAPAALTAPAQTPMERFQLFDAVDAFLRQLADTPRVLVLDDLHAADPSSLQLLHFLVRDLRARPLMVVGTYRDAEARLSPEIGPLLAQIAREATVLPLRRLDRSEVAQFVLEATGSEPATERIDAIHQQTEGNPLFLRELLQLHGSPARQSEGIREVVRARLSLLTSESRRVLEAAAVLGREFFAEPLAAVAGRPELEVRTLLEPAAHAGIVEPLDHPPRWRFSHVLLRQGLYDDLPLERRASLHLAAARAVEGRTGAPPLAELAHHLVNAIPAATPEEAARAALRAGDHAMDLLAFEDARGFYATAQRLLEGVSGAEHTLFEALLGIGLGHLRAADVRLGKEACGHAIALARRLGDGALLARAVLTSTYEFTPGVRDATLIAQLEEALELLPAGDGALRARCMAQLAAERQPEPDTRPAIELARAAVAMARRLNDPATLRLTLTAAAMAMLVYADPEERLAVNQEVFRLALAAGDIRVAVRAALFLTTDHWERGDLIGARAHVRAYEELLQQLPHRRFDWTGAVLSVVESLWAGRFDEAAAARGTIESHIVEDESRGASMAATPLGVACITERYDELPAMEAQLRASFGSLPDEMGACLGEILIAQLYGRAGHRQRAAAQLTTVTAHPVFPRLREPVWLAALADACHLVGDTPLAERLYPAILPIAHRFACLGPFSPSLEPPYTRQLGLLAETMSRFDDAVAHLSDAEQRASAIGMRAHLARLRYELAGTLLRRGRDGDRQRAATLLEQAAVLANELGQAGLLPRIAARSTEVGVTPMPVQSTARPNFSLRREGEYWTVVHGGRTLRLRASRGMQVLAQLVEAPGQELHVLQLVGDGDEARDTGDAGPQLDATAMQRYRRRLLDLREQLEEAEGFGDTARADRAREEMDFLTQELARAVGLGGRDRRTGGAAERARTAVQKRLRGAIQRIEEELPELGRHLDQAIHTGAFCGYLPDGRRRPGRG